MSFLPVVKGKRKSLQSFIDAEISKATDLVTHVPASSYAREEFLESVDSCLSKLTSLSNQYKAVMDELIPLLPADDEDVVETEVAKMTDMSIQLTNSIADLTSLKDRMEKAAKQSETAAVGEIEKERLHIETLRLETEQGEIEQRKQKEEDEKHMAKFPELEIETYDGDILKWTPFWDAWVATAHKNTRVSDAQKLNFLKTKLVGEPKQLIADYMLTNDNYKQAIDALQKKYGNKNSVIAAHHKKFQQISPLNENFSTAQLRTFFNALDCQLRCLRALGERQDHSIFLTIVTSKIPSGFMTQLNIQKGPRKEWTMDSLLQHLEDALIARESADRQTAVTTKKHTENANQPFKGGGRTSNGSENQNLKTATGQMLYSGSGPLQNRNNIAGARPNQGPRQNCLFCGKNHWNDECQEYADCEARKNKIRGRCYRCLQTDHMALQCSFQKRCFYCGEWNVHHRSLCPSKFPPRRTFGNPRQSGHKQETGQSGFQDTANQQKQTSARKNAGTSGQPAPPGKPVDRQSCSHTNESNEEAIFLTALVEIRVPGSSETHTIRVGFDSFSSKVYLKKSVADKMNLPRGEANYIPVFTFASDNTKDVEVATGKIEILLKDGSAVELPVQVTPVIAGGRVYRPTVDLGPLKSTVDAFDISDPLPDKSPALVDIDLMIGVTRYYEFMRPGGYMFLRQGLHLIQTAFGWSFVGGVAPSHPSQFIQSHFAVGQRNLPDVSFVTIVNQTHQSLSHFELPDKQLQIPPNLEDLWELERIGIKDPLDNSDDQRATDQFNKSVVFKDGRYEVSFPKKDDEWNDLPENFALCLGRLKSLLRRLEEDTAKEYNQIIQDQRENRMTEIVNDNSETGPVKHYLPHHPVFTPSKTTTRTRIVFDGAAKKRKSDKSLNEKLLRGPVDKLMVDLAGLLIRFRTKLNAILADIKKAFLQLGLQVADRDLVRFLWLKDPSNPTVENNIEIYRFCRVPFGIISSPFLLTATIDHHLKSVNSAVAEEIRSNIYVDNVVCGAETVDKAMEMYTEGKQIFQEVSMNLCEWISNSEEFMEQINPEDKVKESVVKVLGIQWDTKTDHLTILGSDSAKFQSVQTKRGVLHAMASIFDPLGYFSPVTVAAKLFLQKLWSLKLGWDETFGEQLSAEWKQVVAEMKHVSEFSFPRFVGIATVQGAKEMELLCFCDASVQAFTANIYLRVSCGTECTVDLIFSKTRVAPVKALTIPRKELTSVLIGTRLLNFVEKELRMQIRDKILWSDSQCVLKWIISTKPLSVFVENRLHEIKSHDHINFRYIPTDQNPADLATRPSTWYDFAQKHALWWHGPQWLQQSMESWPEFEIPPISSALLEKMDSENKHNKQDCTITLLAGECSEEMKEKKNFMNLDPNNFSTLHRLLRVTAWIIRFKTKLQNKAKKLVLLKGDDVKQAAKNAILFGEDISAAKILWEKHTQEVHFSDVYEAIQQNKNNTLKNHLGLQIDKDGLLRCHGRLANADLGEDAIFPKLLPKKDSFTFLVISSYHVSLMHSGVSHILAQIRLQYWIPQARKVIKGVLLKCQICRKYEGGAFRAPEMAQLPRARVSRSSPFSFVGVDYLGPLHVKDTTGTAGSSSKVWICLFTCFTVRAVHLELVRDLTGEHFLLCLRRFVSLRGKPVQILSDNAGHFKVTKTAVDILWDGVIQDKDVLSYLAHQGIKWTFIPELAPWFGGLYERLVGLVKRALRKSIGRIQLHFEQLRTLVAEVEAVLNSRPLVFVGSDFEERWTLSPGDFLCLNPKTGFPGIEFDRNDPDYQQGPPSSAEILLETWKKGQHILEQFWQLWYQDYLLSLRERTQKDLKGPRVQVTKEPKVGEVVLIKEDKMPRGTWKIAQVQELNLSSDGLVRSAKLRLPSGNILTRAVTFLYPLECSLNDESVNNVIADSDQEVASSQSAEKVVQKVEGNTRKSTRRTATLAKDKIAQWAKQLQ